MMNYKETNDKELWKRCQSMNDERAYTELFRRYFSRMLDVASSRIKDSAIAEELVMDVFFKLWDRRNRTLIEGDFLSYLFKCTRYSIISHFRKEILVTTGLEQVEASDSEADYLLIAEETLAVYREALEKLTPRRRQAFLMRREENLSYAEIAKRMNVSVSAVENYMTTALDLLRNNMKGCISTFLFFLLSF